MKPDSSEGVKGLDNPEQPVYLRQQKRAEPRGARAIRKSVFRWRTALPAILLLFATGCLLWFAADWLRQDPRFRLNSMELRGEKYLARSEVEEVFRSDHDKNIWQVPLEQRRRELEEMPWVRWATLTLVLPDQLWVAVQERIPLAFLWTRQGVALVDADGVIMESSQKESPQKTSLTFPVVRGVSEAEPLPQRQAKMRLFTALMEDLGRGDPRFQETISEVDLADPQDVRVVVADGSPAIQLHLGAEDFLARFMVYVNQIAQWRQEFASIQSVDLRYAGQVVIHTGLPAGGAAPQTAAPAAPPARSTLPSPAEPPDRTDRSRPSR